MQPLKPFQEYIMAHGNGSYLGFEEQLWTDSRRQPAIELALEQAEVLWGEWV